MDCGISDEQLWSWVDRNAPELEAHLAVCLRCRERAASIRAEIERMRPANGAELDDADTIPLSGRPAGGRLVGQRVGRYTIVRRLGEGGMGTVYLADQVEPFERHVALKIIKLDTGAAEVVARFEAERQALAVMDHPHIAQVFDAGSTDDGRPYFVMELVDGSPITEYCDGHGLDLEGRLVLFIQVCEAIQHAHQKGVIHRDIKPSNVLVTIKNGTPSVKVIDFGVAKAVDQRLTDRTMLTAQGQLIGTPEYMSPEQAGLPAVDIDTRSDVYALGVLLYELLTGSRPFQPETLRAVGLAEILRVIREEDPPRPSTRLARSTDGKARGRRGRRAVSAGILRALRSDLDWVAMKALEKDRSRRYASASEVAADARRFLEGEPVQARKSEWRYVAAKLIRKRRGWVAVVLLLLATVFVGAWVVGLRSARGRAVEAVDAAVLTLLDQELDKLSIGYRRLAAEPPGDFRSLLVHPLTAPILDLHRRAVRTAIVESSASSGGERRAETSDAVCLGFLLGYEDASREPDLMRSHFDEMSMAQWTAAVREFVDRVLVPIEDRPELGVENHEAVLAQMAAAENVELRIQQRSELLESMFGSGLQSGTSILDPYIQIGSIAMVGWMFLLSITIVGLNWRWLAKVLAASMLGLLILGALLVAFLLIGGEEVTNFMQVTVVSGLLVGVLAVGTAALASEDRDLWRAFLAALAAVGVIAVLFLAQDLLIAVDSWLILIVMGPLFVVIMVHQAVNAYRARRS